MYFRVASRMCVHISLSLHNHRRESVCSHLLLIENLSDVRVCVVVCVCICVSKCA